MAGRQIRDRFHRYILPMISLDNTNIKLKNESPKYFAFVFLFISLILFDQIVKYFAHNIFRNFAFAFSLPLPTWFMYSIYAVVILSMTYYIVKSYQNFSVLNKVAWILIFAGAISNIVERIFFGFVRDFIYITFFKWTGVYNMADGFIILGIIILILPLHKHSKASDADSQELGIRN